MRLEKILDNLNSFEKNSFLKIIDGILPQSTKNAKAVDKILNDATRDLKSMDSINISRVFGLLEQEFAKYVGEELQNTTSQLGILVDIIIRDGNCIMKQEWLSRLYEFEIKQLNKKVKEFQSQIDAEKSDLDPVRSRDYKIYRACVKTAYFNDDLNNQERKITFDEQTILNTLAKELELSADEVKLINYMVIPIKQHEIDEVINDLKNIGVIFYSKKTNVVYVADEMVTVLRRLRGKEVADKFFRRVLRNLREPQINLVCKKHNIDWRLPIEQKIKEVIKAGISFSRVLSNDIYKADTTVSEKKKFFNELCDLKLNIGHSIKGSTLEEKLASLVSYFDEVEKDEKVGISVDGYEKLLIDLNSSLPKANKLLKDEFELQEENVMKSAFLLDYNIKPIDVLEIISEADLEHFCVKQSIKTRGDIISNILENYTDAENLFLENYDSIGFRDLAALKENGISVKEADLGILFEDLTKKILLSLGFNVDEKLRKQLNTTKDKIDIVVNMGNGEIILVECKTNKESGYNKFSSVARQLKAYIDLAKKNDQKVIKSLLVAPDFSDDFVKECGLDYELNLSLITSNSLLNIQKAFKKTKLKSFPHNLLMRDVLIQEDRVIKAIER